MSIVLEFINLVVPIDTIKDKYPGGWVACIADHEELIGGRVWYDDHLFRDGAMSPADMKLLVNNWAGLGFEISEYIDGQQKWKDICVVEVMFGGTTLPCDWIEVDAKNKIAFLKKTKPGRVVGRDRHPKLA